MLLTVVGVAPFFRLPPQLGWWVLVLLGSFRGVGVFVKRGRLFMIFAIVMAHSDEEDDCDSDEDDDEKDDDEDDRKISVDFAIHTGFLSI